MPLHHTTPFDRDHEDESSRPAPASSGKGKWAIAADICFIMIKAGSFLTSTYLMTLGLPLLFFLAISGWHMDLLFLQLGNLAARFQGAEPARQIGFLRDVTFILIGAATLIGIWRMPRFLSDVARSHADRSQKS